MKIKTGLLMFTLITLVVMALIVFLKPASSSQQSADLILQINQSKLKLELAFTEETRQKGLMHRLSLPPDSGMLFIYPEERMLSFWMKNTEIPLEIAFIKEDGTIIQINQMKPFDTTSIISRDKVKYALEVNQGWFVKHHVKIGNRIELPGWVKNVSAEP